MTLWMRSRPGLRRRARTRRLRVAARGLLEKRCGAFRASTQTRARATCNTAAGGPRHEETRMTEAADAARTARPRHRDHAGHEALEELPEKRAILESAPSARGPRPCRARPICSSSKLAAEIKARQDEITMLKEKIAAEQKVMATTDHRAVQSITREMDGLRRRQRQDRDGVAAAHGAHRQGDSADAKIDEALTQLAEKERASVDRFKTSAERSRPRSPTWSEDAQRLAASLDPDTVTRYEKIRETKGGVGVGRLDGRRARACRMALPAERLRELAGGRRHRRVPAVPPPDRRTLGERVMTAAVLRTDGGSRGNPGPAGAGFVIEVDGEIVCRGGRYIPSATNNIAEYQAFIWGLENVAALGYSRGAGVRRQRAAREADQRAVPRQERRTQAAVPRRRSASCCGFSSYRVSHVRREMNKAADAMANEAMDACATVGDAPVDPDAGQDSLF